MLTLTVGDGKTYSSISNAVAAIPNPMTEDVTIERYADAGDTRTIIVDQIIIPANSAPAGLYSLTIKGMVGSIKGGDSIVLSSNTSPVQNTIIFSASYNHYGLTLENIKLLANSATIGINCNNVTDYITLKKSYIQSTDAWALYRPAGVIMYDSIIESINNIAIGSGAVTTIINRSIIKAANRCFDAAKTNVFAADSFFISTTNSVFGSYVAISSFTNCALVANGGPIINSALYETVYFPFSLLFKDCLLYSSDGKMDTTASGTIANYLAKYATHTDGSFEADPLLTGTGTAIEYTTPTNGSPLLETNRTPYDNPIYAGQVHAPDNIGPYSDYTVVSADDITSNAGGNYNVANLIPANVKLDVAYGVGENGSYDPLGAPPAKPGLSVVSAGDGQVTLAFTLAVETDTVYARYRTFPSGSWIAEDVLLSRVGSGNITVTGLTNMQNYEFSGYANAGGCDSDWADPVLKVPTDGADIYPLSEDLKDLLVNAGIGTFATVTDWQIFINTEETGPDNCITVYDTGSEVVDRVLSNGKITDKLSAQINLRSIVYQEGINKITAIQTLFENINGFTGINRDYRSIKRQQNFNYVGTDENQRFMFTLNFVVTVDDS